MFDCDNDGILNESEVEFMFDCMMEICQKPNSKSLPASTNSQTYTLQEFLVWTTTSPISQEFSKLVYQLCHICLGLKPLTRSDEGEIVRGWIEREEKATLSPGTIWQIVSMDWWTSWHAYVNYRPDVGGGLSRSSSSVSLSSMPSAAGHKIKKLNATLATNNSNLVVATSYNSLNCDTSNNTKTVNSATPSKNSSTSETTSSSVPTPRPGPIDNSLLVINNAYRGINTLTGEGGKLKNKIIRGKDFELIPERLWKALVQWYGGGPYSSLPRQVIRNREGTIEFELYPLTLKIYRHQIVQRPTHVPTVVGGYSAVAIQASTSGSAPSTTRRYQANVASFSRRTNVHQIHEFLCSRLGVKNEDLRLWYYKDENTMKLLEDDEGISSNLEDIGVKEEEGILVEVRSRDGTWPEEICSLMADRQLSVNHHGIKGVTGLNNLGK